MALKISLDEAVPNGTRVPVAPISRTGPCDRCPNLLVVSCLSFACNPVLGRTAPGNEQWISQRNRFL